MNFLLLLPCFSFNNLLIIQIYCIVFFVIGVCMYVFLPIRFYMIFRLLGNIEHCLAFDTFYFCDV
jgi:hypothetical protein